LEVDVQQGNFKILRLLPQVLILFLVEKWIPPSRSKTAKIGQNTEGILGVKPFNKNIYGNIFIIPIFKRVLCYLDMDDQLAPLQKYSLYHQIKDDLLLTSNSLPRP
jgi:hypothetical protein